VHDVINNLDGCGAENSCRPDEAKKDGEVPHFALITWRCADKFYRRFDFLPF